MINTPVSIIIPSHNRAASLNRLLDKLGTQSYPATLMQVIVVADGCKDHTVSMLKDYKPEFKLDYIEMPGSGAAIARNKGAALAINPILIFLDDDIDPSNDLVKAHAEDHAIENRVVIGYLPLAVSKKPDFYHHTLIAWWEGKFQQMSSRGYRFNYEDLISGNFSISHELFKKVNGFDTSFRCREDYELGMRLIKSNAEFIFSRKAWGYHRDEVTNLDRSLVRKRDEGKADIQFWKSHPDMPTYIQNLYSTNRYTFLNSKYMFFIINMPAITDLFAKLLRQLMGIFERLKLRREWKKINYKLHLYWYTKGILDELHNQKNLNDYLNFKPTAKEENAEFEIDLKHGLQKAEQFLDEVRPSSIKIKFGYHEIGSVPPKPGFEKLSGKHLRKILANELSFSLLKSLAFNQIISGNGKINSVDFQNSTVTKI